MQEYLSQCGVGWEPLDEAARWAAEEAWRTVFGQAFRGRPRLRYGAKADDAYRRERCIEYLIVPFSAGVAGLPVQALGRRLGAYRCRGPLVPLGMICDAEFFVCPADFIWAMVHTHEDYGLGGPYFIRAEWLSAADGRD